jgi:hypothetical protein
MFCQDCTRFDADEEKCRDRKLNPITWDEAVNVANAFGVRAICMFNDHREKLILARQPQLRITNRSR